MHGMDEFVIEKHGSGATMEVVSGGLKVLKVVVVTE